MKRRHFIHLGAASLAACGHSRAADETDTASKAGPFTITIPEKWRATALVEKKPISPVYDAEAWEAYQKERLYVMKPSYGNRPQHWALRIPAALPEGIIFDKKNADDDATAPQILIHKADEWAVAFTDGKAQEKPLAEVIRSLRGKMDAALKDDDRDLSPAFMDASLTFQCLKRRIDFKGGHGIRLVAQWSIEPNIMRRGDLHYLFLGMSDDNSCQIIATFPLDLPGLPGDGDKDHLGHSTANYEKFTEGYDGYATEAKKWLEKHATEITPSLATLDTMMESLVAKTWE